MSAFEYRFTAMGGPAKLYFANGRSALVDRAIEQISTEIRRLERLYSRYLPQSELSVVNRHAGQWQTVSLEMQRLFDFADTCYQQSDGLFDITSGVFRTVWHAKRDSLPTPQEINQCLELVGWLKVQRDQNRLYLPKGMQLDLGGIVKEYAVDAARDIALKLGITNCLIDLAGDISTIGTAENNQPWLMGVVNPFAVNTKRATVPLVNAAITTSGSYERFLTIGGKQYCHVINPKTGWPVSYVSSITIIAPQCVVAGAMSTIAMLLDSECESWLQECGLPWLLITKNGDIKGSLKSEYKNKNELS